MYFVRQRWNRDSQQCAQRTQRIKRHAKSGCRLERSMLVQRYLTRMRVESEFSRISAQGFKQEASTEDWEQASDSRTTSSCSDSSFYFSHVTDLGEDPLGVVVSLSLTAFHNILVIQMSGRKSLWSHPPSCNRLHRRDTGAHANAV
jgi:hypothetical protein